MWSPSRINMLLRTFGVAALLNLLLLSTLGMMLSRLLGTSTSIVARRWRSGPMRDIASNEVAQMIDPWPRDVGRRQIAFDGKQDAERGRALPHRPGDPAGQRHHQLDDLSGGRAGGGHHHEHGRAAAVLGTRGPGQMTCRFRKPGARTRKSS